MFAIIFALIIFPVIVGGGVVYDKNRNKTAFYVTVFGFTVMSGYFTFHNNFLTIHKSNEKKSIFYYKEIFLPKKVKISKTLHILSLSVKTFVGIKNDECLYSFLTSIENTVLSTALFTIKQNLPHINLSNETTLDDNSNDLTIYLKFRAVFNLLSLLIGILHRIGEKINA